MGCKFTTRFYFQYLRNPIQRCSQRKGGGAEPRPPPPEFGSSVNPIQTRGEDYAPHTTHSPPGFKKLSTPLQYVYQIMLKNMSQKYNYLNALWSFTNYVHKMRQIGGRVSIFPGFFQFSSPGTFQSRDLQDLYVAASMSRDLYIFSM